MDGRGCACSRRRTPLDTVSPGPGVGQPCACGCCRPQSKMKRHGPRPADPQPSPSSPASCASEVPAPAAVGLRVGSQLGLSRKLVRNVSSLHTPFRSTQPNLRRRALPHGTCAMTGSPGSRMRERRANRARTPGPRLQTQTHRLTLRCFARQSLPAARSHVLLICVCK